MIPMHYKFSFAIILYAVTVIIDAALGIGTTALIESYTLRVAAAASVLAIYLYLTSKDKTARPALCIAASATLSAISLTQGRADPAVITSIILKIAAVILTIKPEILEVEIITEEPQSSNNKEDIKSNP